MKKMGLIIIVATTFILQSCNPDCDANKKAHCTDTVPSEACEAYFQRWFYNASTNQCEKIAYSGCSAYGFATESECESCKCH